MLMFLRTVNCDVISSKFGNRTETQNYCLINCLKIFSEQEDQLSAKYRNRSSHQRSLLWIFVLFPFLILLINIKQKSKITQKRQNPKPTSFNSVFSLTQHRQEDSYTDHEIGSNLRRKRFCLRLFRKHKVLLKRDY